MWRGRMQCGRGNKIMLRPIMVITDGAESWREFFFFLCEIEKVCALPYVGISAAHLCKMLFQLRSVGEIQLSNTNSFNHFCCNYVELHGAETMFEKNKEWATFLVVQYNSPLSLSCLWKTPLESKREKRVGRNEAASSSNKRALIAPRSDGSLKRKWLNWRINAPSSQTLYFLAPKP